MKTLILMKTALVAAASLIVIAQPAEARSNKHGHHHHRHAKKHSHRHHTHRPVYVAPPAVVISRPVVVARPAYTSHLHTEAQVQRELARRGYYRGVVDGQIGPQTRASIRAYQVDRGLPVTGQIDHRLLRSLRLV